MRGCVQNSPATSKISLHDPEADVQGLWTQRLRQQKGQINCEAEMPSFLSAVRVLFCVLPPQYPITRPEQLCRVLCDLMAHL